MNIKVNADRELKVAELLRADPMCAPVMQEIDLATEASVLHNISTNVIPEVVGITEEQRKHLVAAVHNRFCQLNFEVRKQTQPRWS